MARMSRAWMSVALQVQGDQYYGTIKKVNQSKRTLHLLYDKDEGKDDQEEDKDCPLHVSPQ